MTKLPPPQTNHRNYGRSNSLPMSSFRARLSDHYHTKQLQPRSRQRACASESIKGTALCSEKTIFTAEGGRLSNPTHDPLCSHSRPLSKHESTIPCRCLTTTTYSPRSSDSRRISLGVGQTAQGRWREYDLETFVVQICVFLDQPPRSSNFN